MSDEKSRDRRSHDAPGAHDDTSVTGARRSERTSRAVLPGARTIIGLPTAQQPLDIPEESTPAVLPVRPGLGGRAPSLDDAVPSGARKHTVQGIAPVPHPADAQPDTRYMEPPSETMHASNLGTSQPSAAASHAPSHTRTLAPPAHEPARPSPYATITTEAPRTSPAPAATLSGRPQEQHASPYSATAPAAWRTAVRNMAERQKTQSTPGTVTSPQPPRGTSEVRNSLRLKLDVDADAYDDRHRGVPKSRLPAVLISFVLLLGGLGAAAYWAEEHGGLQTLLGRFGPKQNVVPDDMPDQSAATGAQPSAPAAPTTTAPSVQPAMPAASQTAPAASALSPAHPTIQAAAPASAAHAPAQAATDEQARALADPDAPGTAPSAEPAKPAAKPSVSDKPVAAKSAPHRGPATKPAPRHEPVLKIRDLSGSPQRPPEPSDTPYVPAPFEPPAPDEPR